MYNTLEINNSLWFTRNGYCNPDKIVKLEALKRNYKFTIEELEEFHALLGAFIERVKKDK